MVDQRRLARWSSAHDGVLGPDGAEHLGITRAERRALAAGGGWRSPCPRVLVDTATPTSSRQDMRIALGVGGPASLLSHGSAAWLLGLVPHAPTRVHLTVASTRRPRPPNTVVHRVAVVPLPHFRESMAVTTPERTLIDLAGSGIAVADAVDSALADGLTTLDRLADAVVPKRDTRTPGVAVLREVLFARGHLGSPLPSVLESRMASILEQLHRHHDVPRPSSELSWDGGRYRLDFAWPEQRLAIEVDGFRWHRLPEAKERDDQRSNTLVADGWTILRFSWHTVTSRPTEVAHSILAAFRRCSAGPRS